MLAERENKQTKANTQHQFVSDDAPESALLLREQMRMERKAAVSSRDNGSVC